MTLIFASLDIYPLGVPQGTHVLGSVGDRPFRALSVGQFSRLGSRRAAIFLWMLLSAVWIGAGLPMTAASVPASVDTSAFIAAHSHSRELSLRLAGQIGGDITAVVLNPPHAFVGEGPRMSILDVSDRAHPRRVGQTAFLGLSVTDIHLAPGLAFVTVRDDGLRVVDISDLARPQVIGAWLSPGRAYAVDVAGDHAFIAGGAEGLHVLDVVNPSRPTEVGRFVAPGIVWELRVVGDRAYAACSDGLYILDLTDPVHPRETGSYLTAESVRDLEVLGHLAYIAVDQRGLLVLDVADPTETRLVGSLLPHGGAWSLGISIVDGLAILVNGHVSGEADKDGLLAVDITDPTRPRMLGFYDTPGRATRTAMTSDMVLAADGAGGLDILGVTDPAHLRPLGRYSAFGEVTGIGTTDGLTLVTVANPDTDGDMGTLVVLDTLDPTAVQVLGQLTLRRASCAMGVTAEVAVVSIGCKGFEPWGLSVIDLSRPSDPRELAFMTMPDLVLEAVISGHRALAATRRGLFVIDLTDPRRPILMGQTDIATRARDIQVVGDLAYVAADEGLVVIDMSDPGRPREIGRYLSNAASGVQDVAVSGDRAFLSQGADGLLLLDITNAARMQAVGTVPASISVNRVAVADNLAYLIDGGGLRVLDLSELDQPREAGILWLNGAALSVSHDRVYVADWLYGLVIVAVTDAPTPAPGTGRATSTSPLVTATAPGSPTTLTPTASPTEDPRSVHQLWMPRVMAPAVRPLRPQLGGHSHRAAKATDPKRTLFPSTLASR
jgi:hypothetical protein